MARATEGRTSRRSSVSKADASGRVEEHRLETPRPDLAVLKVGGRLDKIQVLPEERAAGVVAKLAKAMTKPGLTRAQIFQGSSRKVYAYSIYVKDPSKVVREEFSGKKILGRFVSGRFRPLSPRRAL